ncbi:MAG: glycosyltransferase [Methanoregula sp.]|jgi:glycosyltransferase involved in cell wall biosynthesis
MPVVSVIIPLYNKEKYILRTINSILNQTFQDFEVIVVDDGSTDKSADVVRGFVDPRIKLIRQENRGSSPTRNRGIYESTGELLAFIDADDEWLPIHLETLLDLRKRYPDAGIYSDRYTIQTPKGERPVNYQAIPNDKRDCLIPNFFECVAKGDLPVNSSSAGIPRLVFEKYGGFPLAAWGEDMGLFARIAFDYPVAFSWNYGSIYHWDAENRVSNTLELISYEREPIVIEGMVALNTNSVSPLFAPFLKEFIAQCEINRALWNIKAGKPKKAREILRDCNSPLFYRRKIRLLVFSYIPSPVFRFLWKSIRTIKQYLFNHDYSKDPWLK